MKHAPTSVPPEMLMIGSRPPPTTSDSHRYGSGFHGSPVEPKTRRLERSCAAGCSSPGGLQRPDQRRRHAQHVHAVLLDRRPHAVRLRPVRRAFVHHHRGPDAPRADHLPGTHDPPHVGDPVEGLVRVQVGLVEGLGGHLHEEAAVHVHRSLGPARGAGRVGDHQHVLGLRVLAFDAARRLGQPARPHSSQVRSRPGVIATSAPRRS